MIDVIIIAIVLVIFLSAVRHIVKAKKSGQVCIGCPNAKSCGKGCHCDSHSLQDKI